MPIALVTILLGTGTLLLLVLALRPASSPSLRDAGRASSPETQRSSRYAAPRGRSGDARPATGSPVLAAAWDRMHAAGVRWLLLRGAEATGAPCELDILVAPGAVPIVARCLAPLGFVPLPGRPGGSHRQLAAWDAEHRGWWKLDLVEDLAFGRRFELVTGAEAAVLRRRRAGSGGTWVPDPADDALAFALHLLLDRREVRPRDLEALAARLRAAGGTLRGPLAAWLGDLVDGAVAALPAALPDPKARAELARRVRRAYLRRHPVGLAGRLIRGAVARRLGRLPRGGRPRGLEVALLGPDGAGKSALIAALGAGLPVPVRSEYLGAYPASSGGHESGGRNAAPRAVPGLGLVRRLLRLRLAALRGRLHARRGGVALYDRHPLEAGLRSRSLRRRLIARSCPPPDLVLFLDAPPPVLVARKAEHPLAEIERQRAGYRRLATELGAPVVDVDAPREEVRRRVLDIVSPLLAERLAGDPAPAAAQPRRA